MNTTALPTTRPFSIARLVEFFSRAGTLRPLQLKQTPTGDKPLNAKAPRIKLVTGDETIEYAAGMLYVESRITPEAQDALEAKLLKLRDTRDGLVAAATDEYNKVVAKAKAEQEAAVAEAVRTYEQEARSEIIASSSRKS